MVEAGANEVDEEALLEALAIAHDEIKKLCAAQLELARSRRQGRSGTSRPSTSTRTCSAASKAAVLAQLEEATLEQGKLERRDKVADVRAAAAEAVLGDESTPGGPRVAEPRLRQPAEDDHPPPHRRRQAPPGRSLERRDPSDHRSRSA